MLEYFIHNTKLNAKFIIIQENYLRISRKNRKSFQIKYMYLPLDKYTLHGTYIFVIQMISHAPFSQWYQVAGLRFPCKVGAEHPPPPK
jgi:hypothetical protein